MAEVVKAEDEVWYPEESEDSPSIEEITSAIKILLRTKSGPGLVASFIQHNMYNEGGSKLMTFGVEDYCRLSTLPFGTFCSWYTSRFAPMPDERRKETDLSKKKEEYFRNSIKWILAEVTKDQKDYFMLSQNRPDVFAVNVSLEIKY
jgi:hypothetical protein